jgi:hypothetical protein
VRALQGMVKGADMRILLACAIVIATAVSVGGCFHHAQEVVSEPLKVG